MSDPHDYAETRAVVDQLQDAIGDILDSVDDLAQYVDALSLLQVWIDATVDAAKRDLRKRQEQPSEYDGSDDEH